MLTQSVPVSSTPLGATVYADGQLSGHTPLTLELTRNRDHLVTLVEPGYRQADILVARQYLETDVLMRSMQAGINTGTFFNDAAMGMNAALNTVQQEKDSGAAYQLVPPALVVQMLPAGAPNPPAPVGVPPYNGAPIYPAFPPAAVGPAPADPAAAALGAAAAGGGIVPFNRENTRSKTTSTTTTRVLASPGGGTETQSTTTSKTSGTTFGFGYQGNGNGVGAPAPGGGPGMPDIAAPPAPAMPSVPSMGLPSGLGGGALP